MRGSSAAAVRVCVTPSVVVAAAVATPAMSAAISPQPVAASLTLRLISAVVAPCSSTADAMVVW